MKTKLWIVLLLFMAYSVISAQQPLDQIARSWIAQHHTTFKNNNNLALLSTRSSIAGHTLRYQPSLNGIPIYNSEITIHISNENKVTYTLDNTPKKIAPIRTALKKLDDSIPITIAKKHIKAQEPMMSAQSKLYIYTEGDTTILAYVVHIKANAPVGYWEVVINANTKAVLSAKDVSICGVSKKHKNAIHSTKHRKHRPHQFKKQKTSLPMQQVNGTGLVFNPDPLSANRATYGGNYIDNDDADNVVLNAARVPVTLRDIDFTAGVYTLKGPYVEIQDIEIPNKGLFTQNSPDFNFTRGEDGFEAVNCYYHLDTSMRYINETLGISLVSLFNNGVIAYDPSGWNGDDQSSYQNGMLSFGEGNVDDAEDADVIIHELGHGIHDWLTNGSLSQIEGLSEGCGDYWAQSYSRSLNQWTPSDEAYDFVFNWDGHNEFWPGRSTNVTISYPDGLTNDIYSNGSIWATALMRIHDIIGREKTDKAFLEGMAMTNSITNQQQAAIAVRQAAIDMKYSVKDIVVFTTEFTAIGYILPEINFEDKITLFPNPSNTNITIDGLFTDQENVCITNILGQHVLEKTLTTQDNTIDVSQLPNGIYFVLFKDRKKELKFIKN